MNNLREQVLRRVCSILAIPFLLGKDDPFVQRVCQDILEGKGLVIDSEKQLICSLHPVKQDT